MSGTGSDDTKRISTYVPTEQKSEWEDHADDLDMTQSEYIRTMVQAGRRNFTIEPSTQPDSNGADGVSLEDKLLEILTAEEALDWDELVDELTGSVEEDLEEALDTLQEQNRVRYSGRNGGYSLKTDQ